MYIKDIKTGRPFSGRNYTDEEMAIFDCECLNDGAGEILYTVELTRKERAFEKRLDEMAGLIALQEPIDDPNP